MTLEQQLKNLQTIGNPEFARRVAFGLAAICIGLIAVSYAKNTWFFVLMAAMIGGIGFACRGTMRHMQQAAKAWRSGRSQDGQVVISITEGDETVHYNGIVRLADGKGWAMQFVPPQGWKPEVGRPLTVKLYFIAETVWPALLVHPQGVLLPKAQPKPAV